MRCTAMTALLLVCALRGAQAQCRGPVVHLQISKDGVVAWNGVAFKSHQEMVDRFQKEATAQEQPEIHLDLARDVDYAAVYKVLEAAQKTGLHCLGFTGLDQGPKD